MSVPVVPDQSQLVRLGDRKLLDLACPGRGAVLRRTYPLPTKVVGADPVELTAAGLPVEDAVRLAAAFELCRRARSPERGAVIDSPLVAGEILASEFAGSDHEKVVALALDSGNQLISIIEIARGGLDRAQIDPKILFGRLVRIGAAGFILAHNHPSGRGEPSYADVAVTRRISRAATLLELDFVDHVVLGDDGCVSMRDRGLIEEGERMFPSVACSG